MFIYRDMLCVKLIHVSVNRVNVQWCKLIYNDLSDCIYFLNDVYDG